MIKLGGRAAVCGILPGPFKGSADCESAARGVQRFPS